MESDLPATLAPMASKAGPADDLWALSLLRTRAGRAAPGVLTMKPRSAAEVADVLGWASSAGKAVVVRGGGSGVCGAASAHPDEVVLDLTEMNAIRRLDPVSGTVKAEAGVFGPHLEDALGEHGFTLGHFPQSFEISTVGGWVSTKATGQLSTRYGGIEDRLLGLEVVLPGGSILNSPTFPRSSAGPEWWRLFLGAEGTLGVVTAATLSAVMKPAFSTWRCFGLGGMAQGWDVLRSLVHRGVRPSVARLYDAADIAINFSASGVEDQALLLLLFEGEDEVATAEAGIAERVCSSVGGHALSDEPALAWWQHRFEAAGNYRKIMSGQSGLGPSAVVDTFEIAAFWSDLPAAYDAVRSALASSADVVGAHSSHIYASGANIYFTFLVTSAADDAEAERRYDLCWNRGLEAAANAGATISHHHGIGLLKSDAYKIEAASGAEALKAIRAALDPSGTMNPRKLRV